MVAPYALADLVAAAGQIAGFSGELEFDELPDEVVEATKLHLLDVLGCGLAADALGLAGEGRAAMAELGAGGGASVIGRAGPLPAANAALANAMLCHALDYDDTHPDSVCHITTVVAPAAVAVAEEDGLPGRELLSALVVGSETVARIGMSASGDFHARGFHPSSACGVFGAAVACARLGGLDARATTRALGIAGSMSSGLLAFLNDGARTKPFHAGWAAHGGVLAARLAAHGGEGPASVLEGRFGLLEAFTGEPREDAIAAQLADLGERWETLRISYKPFPACHYMHGSLGASASLLDALSPAELDEIDEIVVTVPQGAVELVCEPEAEKRAPRSDYDAKFSIHYSTAAMLVDRRVNLDTYTAARRADPAIASLAAKVRHELKPYASASSGFPGGVRIRMRDGRLLEADFPHQLGAPENPLGEAQVRAKFRDNAALALAPGAVEELEQRVCALEGEDDLHAVFSLLAPRRPAG